MRVTIQIANEDLRHLTESYGGLKMQFQVRDGRRAEKVGSLSVYTPSFSMSNKEVKRVQRDMAKLRKENIKNVEVEVPSFKQVILNVIKIEPDEERRW